MEVIIYDKLILEDYLGFYYVIKIGYFLIGLLCIYSGFKWNVLFLLVLFSEK